MLTIATSSDPTPLSIGHTGKSAVSLQGVPLVTGIGHCGSKRCTRATLLTICRSIRGRTTDDACREGTGTTFPVATMQAHAIQCKLKGVQVFTYTIMQANPHYIYIIIYILYIQNHTKMYVHACTIHIYKGIVHLNTFISVHTS